MAADLIRVRLHFDYAPPAAVGCRMCWLLVDRGSCRVVADLESIIRERFELSRGSILSLFIDDCYLPHTESVLLVRDNDCVRVKVETVSKSTAQTSPEENSRKRQRPAGEDASEECGLALEFKKTKRKKSVVESPAVNGLQAAQASAKKKTKKKAVKEKPKSPPAPLKPSPSTKKPSESAEKAAKSTKKPPSSSSSSSSSSEDEPPAKKAPAPKPAPKPSPTKVTNGRPPSKKLPAPSSSSSSSTDSSTEEDGETSAKVKSANEKPRDADVVHASNGAGHGDEEEIELVIKKPVRHPQGRIVVGPPAAQQAAQGRGKGQRAAREPWGKGRGRGRGSCVRDSYSEERPRDKEEPSYSTDTLTNTSVVLQNRVESKPDYTSMPLLAAPPQVGQKIAFKLLELTENYTPEVSEYKEAKILSFDPTSKQIELEVLTSFQAPVEPGKFDLVYQNPDGSERVEYAVDRCTLISERWDTLLEPRLLI